MYGNELIIDLKNCSNINRKSLRLFVIKLCKEIGMKRYGKCQVVYFGKGKFRGYSLFQFITTSSITGHFTDKDAYINIFSCLDFNKDKVGNFVKNWFKTNEVKTIFNRR